MPGPRLGSIDIRTLGHPGACLLASKSYACHTHSPHLAAYRLLGVWGSRARS